MKRILLISLLTFYSILNAGIIDKNKFTEREKVVIQNYEKEVKYLYYLAKKHAIHSFCGIKKNDKILEEKMIDFINHNNLTELEKRMFLEVAHIRWTTYSNALRDSFTDKENFCKNEIYKFYNENDK